MLMFLSIKSNKNNIEKLWAFGCFVSGVSVDKTFYLDDEDFYGTQQKVTEGELKKWYFWYFSLKSQIKLTIHKFNLSLQKYSFLIPFFCINSSFCMSAPCRCRLVSAV
ncbi:hypothetical protein NQD34_006641 [Periophthalmus magnuspinnatus]|nr:hypothetical protein NQD34_006641 [Periophthalmus magnuspinnatus]